MSEETKKDKYKRIFDKIPVSNFYLMLAYALDTAWRKDKVPLSAEKLATPLELLGFVLTNEVARLLKRGLHREYIEVREKRETLRGKLDINGTISRRIAHENVLVCNYDELTDNNLYNQIIKTTLLTLLKLSEVKKPFRAKIKTELIRMAKIGKIDDILRISWDKLRFQRNNRDYEFLLRICRLILENIIIKNSAGKKEKYGFDEKEAMESIYEKFILNYYKHHFRELLPSKKQVKWNLERCEGESIKLLPTMETDITLTYNGYTLIIDAKYYTTNTVKKATQYYKGTPKINPANLYQIYSYVKNTDTSGKGNVEGMLLYAKTTAEVQPDLCCNIGGNRFSVGTLDLGEDSNKLIEALNKIVYDFKKRATRYNDNLKAL